MVVVPDMVHHFGQVGYEDYTTHNDEKRKDSYISRMSANQDWYKKDIHTSGFWAKHILWNKKPLRRL